MTAPATLNPLATTCSMCELAKTRKKIVWGEGPLSARIMFVGEGPGKQENNSGKPFIGKTGLEHDRLLQRNGVDRSEVYTTNLTKCYFDKQDKEDIPAECINKCSTWLLTEIEQIQPKIIVPLGKFATQFFLQDIRMDFVHGIPFWYNGLLSDQPIIVIPSYHPAAGLHNDSMMTNIQYDYKIACSAYRGRDIGEPRTGLYADAHPDPQYTLLTETPDGLDTLLEQFTDTDTPVAIDTEWARSQPWCLSFSTLPGTAYMIKAKSVELLSMFNDLLRGRYTVIHNILYDWPVLYRMGIDLSLTTPMDTMVMAYLLQDLPQGLKPLAYRIAGMNMGSYTETVFPASAGHAMKYMAEIVERSWDDPEPVLEWKPDGSPHIKHPQNIRKKVERRLMDQWFKGVDVVDWWNTMKPELGKSQVEQILGKLQAGELCDIDFETAKYYACRDADATIRIFPYLWNRITKEEHE